MYEGYLGALIMRQGYYIANGKELPRVAPLQRAKSTARPPFSPEEYEFWYNGRPATRDLPGITGRVGDIKKGQFRDGGSFLRRSCKYTAWNSFYTENVYQVKKFNEFLSASGCPRKAFQSFGGGGTRRPLRLEELGPRPRTPSRRSSPAERLAVDDFNLHVDHGEYVVLLGPSGCGKTTTLRMIGGHDDPTSGDILLDGESLVDAPAAQAADDDGLPALRALPAPHRAPERRVRAEDARRRQGRAPRAQARQSLEMVGLEHARRPQAARSSRAASSSASRSRACSSRSRRRCCSTSRSATSTGSSSCACASSCATSSAQLGLMFIHVTHNQEEALSMADRIVVMNDARIQQIGEPLDDRDAARDRARRPLHGRQQHHPRHGREPRGRPARDRERQRARERAGARGRPRRRRRRRRRGPRRRGRARAGDGAADGGVNSASCEIVFVEFLGDLVKLHLTAEGERMLAKVPGERVPGAPRPRGRARSRSRGRRRMSSSSGS